MKIAVFLPSCRGGGAERVMVTLANEFTDYFQQVDLVLIKAEGPYLDEIKSNVQVIDLDCRWTINSALNFIKYLKSISPFIKYLKSSSPDVVLSTLWYMNILTIVCTKLFSSKTKVIVREASTLSYFEKSGNIIGASIKRYSIALVYRFADTVIAISDGVKQDIEKAIGNHNKGILTIYNPVVDSNIRQKASEIKFLPWDKNDTRPVILGVGRLSKEKNFSLLIEAFALVKREIDARLVILGEGSERSKLENEIERLPFSQDISLPGFIGNPYPSMKNCNVFVLSSSWEGLPNALIQALYLGKNVVSTKCPWGPSEILENGKWGYLVNVDSAVELSNSIIKSLTIQKTETVEDQLEDYCISKFGSSNIVRQYVQLISDIV